ncbi:MULTISPECIES: hypothetical protein [unclassified Exiguobacterium]|uniref:hypothetical protein n=1 Tax=unclassified Exiguobacterium TaxID=2644629 RepID=UPI001BE5D391|nr:MULTISPECIES: hypothetical protein [unclassified Exiguobacterium]
MSFWKNATELFSLIANNVITEGEKKEKRLNKIQSNISNKTDRDIVNKFKNTVSREEKQVCAKELVNRGYLTQDENGKYISTNKSLK